MLHVPALSRARAARRRRRGSWDLLGIAEESTLTTAYGCMGGYIARAYHLVDRVRSITPAFISTTSLAPTIVGGRARLGAHLGAAR